MKLATNQVAKMTGVCPETVRYWVNSGELEAELVDMPVSEGGEQYRYSPEDVLKILKKKYKEYQKEYFELQHRLVIMQESISRLDNNNIWIAREETV